MVTGKYLSFNYKSMKNFNVGKWILVWVLAILLTGVAMVYQSFNGPTKPKRVQLWLNDSQVYQFKLPRSHGGLTGCPVKLFIPDNTVEADLYFRAYPADDEWQMISMQRTGYSLMAILPHQPPAGKLEYYFKFRQEGKVLRTPAAGQVVIRFRGSVPAGIILPHAALMFIAMLLSNVTLFLVLFNFKEYRAFTIVTLIALFIGGLVFGPMVQKHAFGQYWTGFPFGFDLTDNKTLIAFVFWLIALLANIKKERRYLTVIAALVMLVIFSIPHSAKGSELNRETGKIETGMVMTPVIRPIVTR